MIHAFTQNFGTNRALSSSLNYVTKKRLIIFTGNGKRAVQSLSTKRDTKTCFDCNSGASDTVGDARDRLRRTSARQCNRLRIAALRKEASKVEFAIIESDGSDEQQKRRTQRTVLRTKTAKKRDEESDRVDLRAAAKLLRASSVEMNVVVVRDNYKNDSRVSDDDDDGEEDEAKKNKRRQRRRGRNSRTNSGRAATGSAANSTAIDSQQQSTMNTNATVIGKKNTNNKKNNNNNNDANKIIVEEGNDDDDEKGDLLLDAESEKMLGEAVKELLRLENVAIELDDEEFSMKTRDEAKEENNPMGTSDAILSLFETKPTTNLATTMVRGGGGGQDNKNLAQRPAAGARKIVKVEDLEYEQKFARAAGLAVKELRKKLDEGKRARKILVSKNIGLARLCAHRTMKQRNTDANTNFSYQISDMISDGQEGLVKAASKFDPSLGFRFSTYAYAWVFSSIQRGLDRNSNTIRTPQYARLEKTKVKKLERNLEATLGRMPTDEEVANVAGVDVTRIELIGNFGVSYAMPRVRKNLGSIDEATDISDVLLASDGGSGTMPLADFCTLDFEERAIKLVERDLFKDDLEVVFDTLLPRERFVLRHKFGLVEFEDERVEKRGNNTMTSILARRMGLSENSVRAIEQRALQKLRAPQRAAILEKHALLPELEWVSKRVDDTIRNEDIAKIAQSSAVKGIWSSYEIKMMTQMRSQGLAWKDVAKEIGRTETSCKQMYRKIGGSTVKHTPSMDEKLQIAVDIIESGNVIIRKRAAAKKVV
jgi:RNA polymerase sigma factor (sigma-70 family)